MSQGVLVLRKGRGGSVRLVAQAPKQASDAPIAVLPTTISGTMGGSTTYRYVPEKDLYAPMAQVIEHGWAKDRNFDSVVVAITAQQGFNLGKWTRPDITVARAATRSYVLLHVHQSVKASVETVIEETCSEAKQHGIGVIIAEQPSDYDTWEEQVESVRREPDPERLNEFLAQQSLDFREKVMRWLR